GRTHGRTLERATLDSADSGELGRLHHFGWICPLAEPVLCSALSFGCGGSRLFPWDHRLSNPLVLCQGPRSCYGWFFNGGSPGSGHRCTSLCSDPEPELVGFGRMAVGVHPGRPSSGSLRITHARLLDGPSRASFMAWSRGESLDRKQAL